MVVEEITDLFIEAGIHVDAVNVDGLTAGQLCVSREYCNFAEMIFDFLSDHPNDNNLFFSHTAVIHSLLQRYESKETCLQCLASRCIAQHRLAYRETVPKHLESFIQMHSAEKSWNLSFVYNWGVIEFLHRNVISFYFAYTSSASGWLGFEQFDWFSVCNISLEWLNVIRVKHNLWFTIIS